ncbi:retrovirus-related pol polyprotein from transposon TNT 1-94 [Tanacetum coccineum]
MQSLFTRPSALPDTKAKRSAKPLLLNLFPFLRKTSDPNKLGRWIRSSLWNQRRMTVAGARETVAVRSATKWIHALTAKGIWTTMHREMQGNQSGIGSTLQQHGKDPGVSPENQYLLSANWNRLNNSSNYIVDSDARSTYGKSQACSCHLWRNFWYCSFWNETSLLQFLGLRRTDSRKCHDQTSLLRRRPHHKHFSVCPQFLYADLEVIRRLSHLKLRYITLLSKKDVVTGLPKLNLLYMDLCGPMRVASINGKKYILVIVDDYSRYTWTLFLRSKDETPEVLKDFLTMIQRNLQAQVITVRTDRGTEFLNKTLHAYFKEEGIEHQTSTPRTPEQNGVVERRNRTLVEAARTMLSASKIHLNIWG